MLKLTAYIAFAAFIAIQGFKIVDTTKQTMGVRNYAMQQTIDAASK